MAGPSLRRTRICELCGIKFPILQGGMLWLANPELAAAVSNAGGLGTISPLAGMDPKDEGDPIAHFEKMLVRVKDLTGRPFGVNIPLDLGFAGELIEVAIRRTVPIIVTSAGKPLDAPALKEKRLKYLHVVSSVKQALNAEENKVDAVIAAGVESGAHVGKAELPLFSLIPQVVDAVSIPVVAAGGIVDARGLVAAMALGAEGVQMGTRFIAVDENIAHSGYKHAIMEAGDTDTLVTCRGFLPTRCLKTDFSTTLHELEKAGASVDDLKSFIGYRSNRTAQLEGNLNSGELYCGASAGLIKRILPVREVMNRLVDGYQTVLARL